MNIYISCSQTTISKPNMSYHNSTSPVQLNNCLNKVSGAEYRKWYGDYIEKYGGLYNPGFMLNNNIFEDQSNDKGWSKLLGIIKQTPHQENTINVIKNLKARK